MNGDGYDDVVVGAKWVDASTGRAYVYLGGPGGLPAAPSVTLAGLDVPEGQFGYSVAGAR